MILYTGNTPYCYANSLHMCLKAAGISPLPETGFLECLTLMPFGNFYVRNEAHPMFFPSGASTEPDSGLTLALKALGWAADEHWGETANDALARLREAVQQNPVLVGPVDMAYLTYNPNYPFLNGEDHFMAVLEVQETEIVMHDPQQYPFAPLPLEKFIEAWRAEKVDYGRRPYMQRSNFRQIELVSRQETINRTIDAAKINLKTSLGGPQHFTSVEALEKMAEDLHSGVGEKMREMLVYFSLPLGARRCLDAAAFFQEAGLLEAASLLERKSRLYGRAQYHAVGKCFDDAAEVFSEMARNEKELIAIL